MRRSDLLFDRADKSTVAFAEFLREIGIPGDDLKGVNDALQARFFQKKADGSPAERWELKEVQVSCPQEKIMQHLAACGFVAASEPTFLNYDYAAWPGALLLRATARLNDLVQAWRGGVCWQELIVFGGKRALHQEKESQDALCDKNVSPPIRDSWIPAWWPATELEMMKFRWEQLEIPDGMRDVRAIFVDAPMKPPTKEGGQPIRPNTEDTIRYWLETEKPEPGSMLVSSGAPYGMAQDEAFWTLLEPLGFSVETFGHMAPDLPIEVLMREVAGCVNRIFHARSK